MSSSDFKEFLSGFDVQKKIDKVAKKYKKKRIALYGAGKYSKQIFENYNLSKLNIVAVADAKFEDKKNRQFFGLNCIEPKELANFDCDVILISNYDYKKFLTILDDQILYLNKNERIEIRPLLKLTFKDLFL